MTVETRAQAIARLKTEFPTLADSVNGERINLGATAYAQRIGEWADAQIRQQQADDTVATQRTRRQQFVAGVAALRDDDAALNPPTGTPTNVQVLAATRHCVKALLFLADVLKDASIAGQD